MMTCEPYWITPTLAIVPRPSGGKKLRDEIKAMRQAGIDVLVSMLEMPEVTELGLDEEEIEARRTGMRFIGFPVRDHSTPSDAEQFDRLLSLLDRLMGEGKRIGIHCRACIGRSSVLAASLLVRSGMKLEEVWTQIGKARGLPVPETSEQRKFVQSQIKQKPWHLL